MTLGADEQTEQALALAYGYLNRRERTESELRGQLERRGVDAAAVNDALAALTGQGLLDDERYARLFVEDKRGLEQWGNERIRRTLQARGLDPDLIERTLGAGSGDGDGDGETELDRALALLRRRFPSPPVDRRERERALGLLLRKGYDSELAFDALAVLARDARGNDVR